jgi:hypothetical protein
VSAAADRTAGHTAERAAELAARLRILADGVETLGRRLEAVIQADHRTRWSGPHRERVEAELAAIRKQHRALAEDLRTAATATPDAPPR